MLSIVLLMALGKLQELVYQEQSAAWHWALAYALLQFGLSVLDGGVLPALLGALLIGLYAWAYFALLRAWVDHLLLWLLLYFGGALLPWLLLARLMQIAAHEAT